MNINRNEMTHKLDREKPNRVNFDRDKEKSWKERVWTEVSW